MTCYLYVREYPPRQAAPGRVSLAVICPAAHYRQRSISDCNCSVHHESIDRKDVFPSGILVPQTFGSMATWNPHVHVLITDTCWDRHGVGSILSGNTCSSFMRLRRQLWDEREPGPPPDFPQMICEPCADYFPGRTMFPGFPGNHKLLAMLVSGISREPQASGHAGFRQRNSDICVRMSSFWKQIRGLRKNYFPTIYFS